MKLINKELVDKFIERHANSGKALNRWVEQMENASFMCTYKTNGNQSGSE